MEKSTVGWTALGIAGLVGLGVAARGLLSRRARIVRAAVAVTPSTRDQFVNGSLVSQGRAFGKGYSSCGDLWAYVLDVAGAAPEFVNRDDPKRGLRWGAGQNISKPVAAAKKAGAWVPYAAGRQPKAGDLVLIGDNSPGQLEHVFVVTRVRPDGSWETAEFGGAQNSGHRDVRRVEGGRVGGRKVQGWIDVDKVPT